MNQRVADREIEVKGSQVCSQERTSEVFLLASSLQPDAESKLLLLHCSQTVHSQFKVKNSIKSTTDPILKKIFSVAEVLCGSNLKVIGYETINIY